MMDRLLNKKPNVDAMYQIVPKDKKGVFISWIELRPALYFYPGVTRVSEQQGIDHNYSS
jgi:hypothetical protein